MVGGAGTGAAGADDRRAGANGCAARSARPTAWLGAAPPDARSGAALVEDLRAGLDRVRRPKDAVELERMRIAALATRAAFAAAVPFLRDGVSEREVQIELETAAFRAGGDAMAYDTIIGGGTNSAVLHFAPSARVLRSGELGADRRRRGVSLLRERHHAHVSRRRPVRIRAAGRAPRASSAPPSWHRSSGAAPAPNGATCI